MRRESLDKAIGILDIWIARPLIILYVFSMVIFPWINGGQDWQYVHDVWNEWQSLNAGVFALISSYVAFNISTYNEEKKRQRAFVAARAFLPQALSDLTVYFKQCSALLREAYTIIEEEGRRPPPLKSEAPSLRGGVNETFSRCIEVAEPEVASYLAQILMKLQIVSSRVRELKGSFGNSGSEIWGRHYVMSNIHSLGELQVLINRVFDYARALQQFDPSKPTWEDYRNAFGNLDIDVEDIDDLERYTKQRIAREASAGRTFQGAPYVQRSPVSGKQ